MTDSDARGRQFAFTPMFPLFSKSNLIKKNGSNFVQFTYDGSSQRVKKYNYTTGQTTLYFGELYETRAGVGTIHLFAGSNRVASVLADGRIQFYHTDHLGSASVITDSNGNRKEQMVYFPFGAYRAVGNINGTYDYNPSFPDVFYTFTDQEDDDDLGFYNYGARLYDPVLGRFISPDSMVPEPFNPQSFNRYSYTLNNPLRYIDPSGNQYDEYDLSWGDPWAGYNYDTWGSSWNLSFNFRPSSASSYSNYGYENFTSSITSSSSNLGAIVLNNWTNFQGVAYEQGGGKCSNCQYTDGPPPVVLDRIDPYSMIGSPQQQQNDLYGLRWMKAGYWDEHSGVDIAPRPKPAYEFADFKAHPGGGDVIRTGSDFIQYRPSGWPSNAYLIIRHLNVHPDISGGGGGAPGGTTLGNLAQHPGGTHAHFELWFGVKRYNPAFGLLLRY